jgi:hypothetical protein
MKTVVKVIAVLVFLSGFVWFLQGLALLPGSYMFGNPQWTVNGAVTMVIAGAVFWFANRRR